jgi:hypothetical protein
MACSGTALLLLLIPTKVGAKRIQAVKFIKELSMLLTWQYLKHVNYCFSQTQHTCYGFMTLLFYVKKRPSIAFINVDKTITLHNLIVVDLI